METNKTLMLRVGIFVTLGMILLVWLSLKSESSTRVKNGYLLFTVFEQVRGIEKGSNVTMSGVEVGKVENILFENETGKVRVDLMVNNNVKIRKDSLAGIYMKSLLGQNVINIIPGKERNYMKAGDEMKTKDTVDLDEIIQTVSDIGNNAKEFLNNLNENQRGLIDKISSVIDENRDNLKQTTDAFAKAAPKIENVVSNLDKIVGNVKKGEGTLGKLINDDSVYMNFQQIGNDLADVSKKINSGEGTLGKLIADDSLHTTAMDSFKIIKEAAQELNQFLTQNQGKLNDVVDSLKETIPNFQKTAENLREVSEKINKGEGTLGKLINDPALYNDAKDALNQVKQTFQENEEQAVMRSFLSIMFGSMM